MLHFTGGRIDLLVTPNHRILYYNSGYPRVDTAEHFSNLKYQYLPIQNTVVPIWRNTKYFELPAIEKGHRWKSIKCPGIKIPMGDWCAFMGWFLSEGSTRGSKGGKIRNGQYGVHISQIKKESLDIIRNDLSKLPFKWSKGKIGFETNNKQLWSYLGQFGHSGERYIPDEIKFSGTENLSIFIDRMVLGDGTYKRRDGGFAYYTTSERLANDFREV